MNCKDFREIADSYLSNELLVETNHEILRHLENCVDCRRELAARRELREHLRSAVKNAPQSQLNANFAARLTNDLREKYLAKQSRWSFANFIGTNPVLAGVLAVLVLSAMIGLVWKFGRIANSSEIAHLNPPTPNQANTITADEQNSLLIYRASFVEMEQDALSDHQHCALKFSLKEKPITLDEAAKKYGNFNKDLDKAVFEPLKEVFGDKVKLLEAHSCIINGRRFAHVVLKYQERVISVLVAKREDGTQIENSDAISCQSLEDLRVACFSTDKFGVFVVSDLDETENLKIARTISPAVKKHFEQSGTKA
ncbi:MAG: zf-HC2 domain-containing protein [Actinomycetota bacterium]